MSPPPLTEADDAPASGAGQALVDVAAHALALVAPPRCAACGAQLGPPREPLCPACRRELPWLRAPLCARCALPLPCAAAGAPCPAGSAAFDRAWAPLAYAGPARAVVAALKFSGALGLADLMAAQVAANAPPGLLAAPLVPVPSHPSHARARGFDPAARVARALSRRTGLALRPCLRREGAPERQLGAGRGGRLAPGRLAFAARREPPREAILVDDVHTTGATLDACARALRAAGAERVAAVAYARTLRG
jgi:predicted amidophosphoribosyltransferase